MKRVGIAILGVGIALGFAAISFATTSASAQTATGEPSLRATVPSGGAVLRAAEPANDTHQARLEQQSLDAMDLIYQGRLEEAERLIDVMLKEAPNDPRPYFMRARLMRERVSEQNASRSSLKPQMKAIHEVLDRCVEVSDRILDRDPGSQLGLLYRGWGRMFKGQLHALAFEHWAAGSQAKVGKKDIDRVMELDPENEEAHMILGTYYYFAGILPSTLKIASVVLGIPKGDRVRGIDYLKYAGDREGLARYDALGILGAALFGFEGRLEEAVPVFDTLNVKYPDNARLVEPLAVIDFFIPARLGRGAARYNRAIEAGDRNHDPATRNAAARLRLYRALTGVLTGRLQEARADLELLHRDPPDQPDWFATDIELYLTEVYLMQGERELAKDIYRDASRDQPMQRRLRPMLRTSPDADRDEVAWIQRLQPAARAMHEGRLDDAERELKGASAKNSMFLDFCRGELEMLHGRPAAARPFFERLIDNKRASRWRLLPYFGRLRLAETYRLQGDGDRAGAILEDLINSQDVKDLIRHVTGARSRFCKRL